MTMMNADSQSVFNQFESESQPPPDLKQKPIGKKKLVGWWWGGLIVILVWLAIRFQAQVSPEVTVPSPTPGHVGVIKTTGTEAQLSVLSSLVEKANPEMVQVNLPVLDMAVEF